MSDKTMYVEKNRLVRSVDLIDGKIVLEYANPLDVYEHPKDGVVKTLSELADEFPKWAASVCVLTPLDKLEYPPGGPANQLKYFYCRGPTHWEFYNPQAKKDFLNAAENGYVKPETKKEIKK